MKIADGWQILQTTKYNSHSGKFLPLMRLFLRSDYLVMGQTPNTGKTERSRPPAKILHNGPLSNVDGNEERPNRKRYRTLLLFR